jgi:hypothetical protein
MWKLLASGVVDLLTPAIYVNISECFILCCDSSTMKTKPETNSFLKFIIMKNKAAFDPMNIDMTM